MIDFVCKLLPQNPKTCQEMDRIPTILTEILKLRIKMDNTIELLRKNKHEDAKKLLGLTIEFLPCQLWPT